MPAWTPVMLDFKNTYPFNSRAVLERGWVGGWVITPFYAINALCKISVGVGRFDASDGEGGNYAVYTRSLES